MAERISKKAANDIMEILSSKSKIEILGDGRYRVPSQTTKGKAYTTVVGSEAEYCDCPGSRKGTVTCKHIRAVQLLHMMDGIVAEIGCAGDAKAAAARPKRGTEIPEIRPSCRTECLSTKFRKWGKRGTKRKGRVQTYKCYKCNTRFSADPAAHRLAVSPRHVARVVGTYFDGLSYKETSDHVRREGIDVSPSTVENYVSRVVDACLEYVLTLFPDISDTWSIDGLEVTIRKSLKRYFYCIMDHRSRLMLALREFRTRGSSDLEGLSRAPGSWPAASQGCCRRTRRRRSPRPPGRRSGRAGTDGIARVPQRGGPHTRGKDGQPAGEGRAHPGPAGAPVRARRRGRQRPHEGHDDPVQLLQESRCAGPDAGRRRRPGPTRGRSLAGAVRARRAGRMSAAYARHGNPGNAARRNPRKSATR